MLATACLHAAIYRRRKKNYIAHSFQSTLSIHFPNMIFRIIILVFIALGSHGRVCSSHQPPTNQSNPNPSFPVNQMGSQGHSTPTSQSNQTSSPPVYPTQPVHPLNTVLPFMVRVPPPPSHLTQQEQNTHSPMHSTLPGQTT